MHLVDDPLLPQVVEVADDERAERRQFFLSVGVDVLVVAIFVVIECHVLLASAILAGSGSLEQLTAQG